MGRRLRSIGTWIRDRAYGWLIVIGVGVLWMTERPFFYDCHPHWQLFLKELAFACIIAAIFGLTIDKYQREEFTKLVNQEREELKRDIFLYAYGHTVPDQIRNEIKERILTCPFQREELRIDWDFSAVDGRPDHVSVEKRQTYTLRNNTPQIQKFMFTLTQISAAEHEVLLTTEFQCLKVRRKNVPEKTWNLGDMTDKRPPDDPHVRYISKEIELAAWEHVDVFYATKETRRIFHDDAWGARHPVIGTTLISIRVNYPLNLDVSASCKAQSLETRPEHQPPHRYAWRFDEGLLPHQAIFFSWSPRQDLVAAAVVAPAEAGGAGGQN